MTRENALEQVAGDQDFLNEVLADLLIESATAEVELQAAINAKNFDGIMKAAHRIKGSASYLCCDQLRDTSFTLQNMGHAGNGLIDPAAKDALISDVISVYAIFKESLTNLRSVVNARLNT